MTTLTSLGGEERAAIHLGKPEVAAATFTCNNKAVALTVWWQYCVVVRSTGVNI